MRVNDSKYKKKEEEKDILIMRILKFKNPRHTTVHIN